MTNNLTPTIFAAVAIIAMQSACAQPPDCPPAGDLKLTVGQYQLNLNEKKPICVTVPGTFKIIIHNPPSSGVTVGAGDATVKAKSSSGLTIEGDNAAPVNKITVEVDGSADPGDVFEFLIKVEGIGVLDPKVRVVDNNMMMSLQSAAFYDALDTLGLTLEDANKLRPPPDEAE